MCCGSLLSTVMSSATCECMDQQQRLTRRNLFTAVQTNSKSTVFVFKFEFYGRLCFLQINFLVWLFRIQNKAALPEKNKIIMITLLEIFIQIQHVVNM